MPDVTQILADIKAGTAEPGDLVPIVYQQLRGMAAQRLSHERVGHTLQVTALVNEAYLRLFGGEPPPSWENRTHFFAAAAEAMRRILVDYARRRLSLKRGGEFSRVTIEDSDVEVEVQLDELLDVNHVLDKLVQHDPAKAEVVKLRYFAGLTMSEVAEVMGISLPTANRYWAYARAWLFREIAEEDEASQGAD